MNRQIWSRFDTALLRRCPRRQMPRQRRLLEDGKAIVDPNTITRESFSCPILSTCSIAEE